MTHSTVALDDVELDTLLIALSELNVYNQTPEIGLAIDRLLSRLKRVKGQRAVREFQDELLNASPEDFIG